MIKGYSTSRILSIVFVEVSISIISQVTKAMISVTNVNIRNNITKIYIIYPFIIQNRYMAYPNSASVYNRIYDNT